MFKKPEGELLDDLQLLVDISLGGGAEECLDMAPVDAHVLWWRESRWKKSYFSNKCWTRILKKIYFFLDLRWQNIAMLFQNIDQFS